MLTYNHSIRLHHHGDAYIQGISHDRKVTVDELYGDDDNMAQHIITWDGTFVRSIDVPADASVPKTLELPADATRPTSPQRSRQQDFHGARLRGKRADERIDDLVRPLSLTEKMLLGSHLGLNVPAPMILGIAESVALAEATLSDTHSVICRRWRIVYALMQPQRAANGEVYDYDNVELQLAYIQDWKTSDEADWKALLIGLPGVKLHRPMDALRYEEWLLIADGGAADRHSQIHIWKIDAP